MRGLLHMDNPVINCFNKLVDCFVLSLCWIAASLPIITIGASCGALYRTVCRSIRRDEGYPLRMFWETYCKNLKKCILTWLPACAVYIFFIVDAVIFTGRMALENSEAYASGRCGKSQKWTVMPLLYLPSVFFFIFIFFDIHRR